MIEKELRISTYLPIYARVIRKTKAECPWAADEDRLRG